MSKKQETSESPIPLQNEDNVGISVTVQYIKDVSFENPKPLTSLMIRDRAPEIDVNIQVYTTGLGENAYEVSLIVQGQASFDDEPAFIVELTYAGIFILENVPEELIQPILLIECPRILFPFARNIVADLTRDGGYPSLMLKPIDFAELYRQRQVMPEEGHA